MEPRCVGINDQSRFDRPIIEDGHLSEDLLLSRRELRRHIDQHEVSATRENASGHFDVAIGRNRLPHH